MGDGAEKRVELTPIKFEPFSNIENNSIFNESIVGNENSSVSGLINELKNSDWVKRGLDAYINLEERDNCPFCQQETLDRDLVKEIENYFNNSYQENIDKLKTLNSQYKEYALLEKYQRDFFTQKQEIEFKNLHDNFIKILDKNLDSIGNKINNPSQSAEILLSKDHIDKLNGFIATINTEIKSFNIKLDNKNKTIAGLKNEFWQIQRKDYDQTISNYLTTKKKT